MKRFTKTASSTIAINGLKASISLFFGPFLTSYFVTSSFESLKQLSIFYIIDYAVMALLVLPISYFSERGHRRITFWIGVVLDFLSALFVVYMKGNLLNFVWLFAIIRGLTESFYWVPYNGFMAYCVSPGEDRTNFETAKVVTGKLIRIFVPIVFGTLISTSSYVRTAILIAVLGFCSILLSLQIDDSTVGRDFHPYKVLGQVFKQKKAFRSFWITSILTFIETIPTLLFSAYLAQLGSDFSLGLWVSGASILFMVVQFLMNFLKPKVRFTYLWITLIVLTCLAFCIFQNTITIIVFYLTYTVCYGFLGIERSKFLFSFWAETDFYVTGEFSLNCVRVGTFFVLFILSSKVPRLISWFFLFCMVMFYVHYALIDSCKTLKNEE